MWLSSLTICCISRTVASLVKFVSSGFWLFSECKILFMWSSSCSNWNFLKIDIILMMPKQAGSSIIGIISLYSGYSRIVFITISWSSTGFLPIYFLSYSIEPIIALAHIFWSILLNSSCAFPIWSSEKRSIINVFVLASDSLTSRYLRYDAVS